MITFKTEGTQVTVEVHTDVSVEKPIVVMRWEAGSELFAQLLWERINDKFQTTIEKIREEEYNQGWSDKAKKKQKRDWFHIAFKQVW